MSNTKRKAVAIVMAYGNLIIQNLVSFMLTPIMIAVWSDASYGVYKIILSLMGYFMLIDSGIKNSVIRFVSEYRSNNDKKSARKYVATIILFYAVASVILCAIVYVFSLFIPNIYSNSLSHDEIQTVLLSLKWLVMYTVGTLIFNCFGSFIRGYNKQICIQFINIIRSIIRFVVLYILLNLNYNVIQVIAADAIMSILFAIVVLVIVFFILCVPPEFSEIDKAYMKSIFDFSSVMLLYTFAHSIFWSAGNFLVGIMTSSVAAAVYATSVTLTNVYQASSSAISQVLVPDIMVEGFSENNTDRLNDMMVHVGKLKMYVMMLILLGFTIFGREFVFLWIGEKYSDTYALALLVMGPLTFGMLHDVPSNIMLARNKHKTLAIITMAAAVINIIISSVLIKYFDIYGAAIGTMLSYIVVYIVISSIYFNKCLQFDMKRLYVFTVVKNLPVFAVITMIGFLVDNIPIYGWIGLIGKIAIFIVLYFFFIITLSPERKQTFKYLKSIRRS